MYTPILILDSLEQIRRLAVICLLLSLFPAIAALTYIAHHAFPDSRTQVDKKLDVNVTLGLSRPLTNATTKAEESR